MYPNNLDLWKQTAKQVTSAPTPAPAPRPVARIQGERQVLSRFFFSFMTVLIVLLGFNAPETVTYYMVQQGGLPARLSSLVLLGCACLAWLDVFLNDMLPSRFSFYFDRRHRYILWSVIGITYVGYALILSKLHYSPFSVSFFTLLGVWASSIATLDVIYEFRERL